MSGQLTKGLLLRVFDRLNEKLREADEHGEVYIVGGAMMILAHDAARATNDVDSHIRRGGSTITRAVAEIGDQEGLGKYWLNEAVTLRYLPQEPDRRERAVYSNSHLTVKGASIERMIAMKLHAGRQPDRDDLDILLAEARIDTRAEALRIHERTYGDEPMTEEADQYLIDRYRPRPVGPNETAGHPQTGEAGKGKGWTR